MLCKYLLTPRGTDFRFQILDFRFQISESHSRGAVPGLSRSDPFSHSDNKIKSQSHISTT